MLFGNILWKIVDWKYKNRLETKYWERSPFRTIRFLKKIWAQNQLFRNDVRWIGVAIWTRTRDYRKCVTKVCPCPRFSNNNPVRTRVHVQSNDFVRVHGQSPKKSRVRIRVRIFHKFVSDSMSERSLCPCPHMTLCLNLVIYLSRVQRFKVDT